MKREFLVNLSFLLIINLIIKPLYLFGVDRVVQNTLEPGAYGMYFALFNFTLIFQIISDLGIQYFNNRHIAQHPHLLDKYFPIFFGLKLLLSGIYGLVVWVGAWWLGYWASQPLLLACLIIYQLLSSLLLFLRANISGLGWYGWDSLLSVTDRGLAIVVLGIPLWLGWLPPGFSIEWFAGIQVGVMAVAVSLALLLLRRRLGRIRLRWRSLLTRWVLRAAMPYALAVALMSVYTRVDGVLLERLLVDGTQAAARYAAAFRLLDAANMIGYLFAALLLPMYAKLLQQRQDVLPLVHLGIQLLWSGAFALVSAVVIFREPIMATLYPGPSTTGGALLGWLMISFIPMTGSYVFSTLLVARGSLMPLNGVYLAGVGFNFLLNLALIPSWGALGAAITNCLTQWAIFGGQLWWCRRLLGVGLSGDQVRRFAGLMLWTVAGSWAAYHLGFGRYGWWALIVALGWSMLGSIALGLLPWREWRTWLPAAR